MTALGARIAFAGIDWAAIPDRAGVYVISTDEEVLYVGMAGRNGAGSLRRRLQDHASGQMVNMFAQYLFLAVVQFTMSERITHPRAAQAACRAFVRERCFLQYAEAADATAARQLEVALKKSLKPRLNP